MKRIDVSASLLIAAGFVLHTYTAVAKAHAFDPSFWLLAISPYLVAGVMLLYFRKPHAAFGALVIPIFMDIGTYYSVFISPQSSTAPLALLFVPLWNLFLFVPFGGVVGWFIGKRSMKEESITQVIP